ncbi:hypothetical protein EIP86_000260 [Pleurotus ostreatoroseus]|nr:hypothetical protein EIP86_000260 [Pleurotus ostreatoroseus]
MPQRTNGLSNGTASATPESVMRQASAIRFSGDRISTRPPPLLPAHIPTFSLSLSSTRTDLVLFDNKTPRSEDSAGPSAFSFQLKRLYRENLSAEARVQSEDREGDMVEQTEHGLHPQHVRMLTTVGAVGEEAEDANE